MTIYFIITIVFFILVAKVISALDFQWLYDKNSVVYYRAIYFFNIVYRHGYIYVIIFTIALIIFFILLYIYLTFEKLFLYVFSYIGK